MHLRKHHYELQDTWKNPTAISMRLAVQSSFQMLEGHSEFMGTWGDSFDNTGKGWGAKLALVIDEQLCFAWC